MYGEALYKEAKEQRLIGHIKGKEKGPVMVFLGGIHGNEPSGVYALERVFNVLNKQESNIKGDFYALRGNINALEKGIRYEKEDLNRIWTPHRMDALKEGTALITNQDQLEQKELFDMLMNILEKHEGPFYFMDLHTTSSHTIPFITLNDTLLNRTFTMQYPVPIILGIEEYLIGPALSYINELGFVAFGFEGGQHEDTQAVENHEAFIYLSLVLSGCLPKSSDIEYYLTKLKKASVGISGFYEIFQRQKVADSDQFVMRPGFVNFQCVKRLTYLAKSNGQAIFSPENARLLMPLYQKQGDDGFFLIRRIAPIFLKISSLLRKISFDSFLTILPGVSWLNPQRNGLKINLKIARFFTKPVFHLLGYRSVEINEEYMLAFSREAASRSKDYKEANWS